MALLTAGYWPSTYWPSAYWVADYWPEYEVETDEVINNGIFRAAVARKRREEGKRREEQEIMNIIKAFIKVQGDRP